MVNTSTFENMQIEKLRNHDGNIRSTIGEIDELADSIKAQGILQPLTVAPHPTLEGDFTVIAGHRRLQAAKRAGLSYLPVVINHSLVSKADQITAMLVENLQRADITMIDEAKAYQQLELEGLNLNKIAKSTGRARRTVVERLKLTKLSEEIQEKVAGHQVTLEKALEVARFEKHPEVMAELEAKVVDAPWNWSYSVRLAEEQVAWLEDTRPALQAAVDEGRIETVARPEGQVYEWYPKWDFWATHAVTLEEAIEGGCSLVLDETADKSKYGYFIRPKAEPVVHEPTEEELAEAKARVERDQMITDLGTARAVEDDFLAEKLGTPPKGVAQVLGARLVQEVVGDGTIKNLLGLDPEDDGYGFVMRKLSAEQLLLLLAVDHFRQDVGNFHNWNPNGYYVSGLMQEWSDIRENHLGYELTPIEAKVFDYWWDVQAKAKADREAHEAAAEEGEDDE